MVKIDLLRIKNSNSIIIIMIKQQEQQQHLRKEKQQIQATHKYIYIYAIPLHLFVQQPRWFQLKKPIPPVLLPHALTLSRQTFSPPLRSEIQK